MLLSDMIRLTGASVPQAFGKYFDGDASCVWGGVMRELGMTQADVGRLVCLSLRLDGRAYSVGAYWENVSLYRIPQLRWHWPWAFQTRTMTGYTIADWMVFLNDGSRWSRTRIADWVAASV